MAKKLPRKGIKMIEEKERFPDPLDQADHYRESVIDDGVAAAMRKALDIPAGNPGECCMCGEISGRLVQGACSPCRDKYKLP